MIRHNIGHPKPCAHQKTCQNVDGIFSEICNFDSKPKIFYVTFSVILGTVPFDQNINFLNIFYRLTQGFLLSSTQQILDRLAASTQDSIDALRKMNPELVSNSPEVSKAGELIREADNSKHLL